MFRRGADHLAAWRAKRSCPTEVVAAAPALTEESHASPAAAPRGGVMPAADQSPRTGHGKAGSGPGLGNWPRLEDQGSGRTKRRQKPRMPAAGIAEPATPAVPAGSSGLAAADRRRFCCVTMSISGNGTA